MLPGARPGCVVTLTGLAGGSNPASVQTLGENGPLSSPTTIDVTGKKARTYNVTGADTRSVVITSPRQTKASMTCTEELPYAWMLRITWPWSLVYSTLNLTTTYTERSSESASSRFALIPAQSRFNELHVSTTDATRLKLGGTTVTIPKNGRITLENIAASSAEFQTAAGATSTGYLTQRLKGPLWGTAAVSMPEEFAAREFTIPHVYNDPSSQGAFLAVNISGKDAVLYLTLMGDKRTELKTVRETLPANGTYSAIPKELFGDTTNGKWIRGRSDQPVSALTLDAGGWQVVANTATTRFDAGYRHLATNVKPGDWHIFESQSDYSETIDMIGRDAEGKQVATATQTIAARDKLVIDITKTLPGAATVEYNVQWSGDTTRNMGRVSGVAYGIADGKVTARTIDCINDFQQLIEVDNYNPRYGEYTGVVGDGKATVRATVRMNGIEEFLKVTSVGQYTDYNLIYNWFATMMNVTPARTVKATQQTSTGVTDYDGSLNRKLTQKMVVTVTANTGQRYLETGTPLTFMPVMDYDVDSVNGAGFSYNAVKNDPEGFAKIMSTPGAFTTQGTYEGVLSWTKTVTDGTAGNDELEKMVLGLAQNGIGIYLVHANMPPSSSALYFTSSAAAQQTKLDLQKFFRVGKGY